ncbi:MAG: CBS domain-containing protein [Oligoflexia bacterium]|nr:CBS domain-containing protein [Oligoflexia bacterium]
MVVASQFMNSAPTTVGPDLPVSALAQQLLAAGVEGACVVRDGKLFGVVTTMDLVYKEKNLHLPTVFTFMDMVIPLGWQRAKDELSKIEGLTVKQIMTADPVTVGPDAALASIATLMVEGHISMLPVVDHGRLVGVIDKRAVLKAAFPVASGSGDQEK